MGWDYGRTIDGQERLTFYDSDGSTVELATGQASDPERRVLGMRILFDDAGDACLTEHALILTQREVEDLLPLLEEFVRSGRLAGD